MNRLTLWRIPILSAAKRSGSGLTAKLAFVLLVACLQTACQTVPKNPSVGSMEWLDDQRALQSRVEQVESLNDWQYSAKASIRAGDSVEQFNVDWRFEAGQHVVRLFGPLGVGAVRLDYGMSGARLSNGDGLIHTGPDATTLLHDITGLVIPVAALEYWLFAVPKPHFYANYKWSSDVQSQVASIQQLGWLSDYSDYRDWATSDSVSASNEETLSGVWLPRKIQVQGLGPEGQNVTIKIVTKSWRLESS